MTVPPEKTILATSSAISSNSRLFASTMRPKRSGGIATEPRSDPQPRAGTDCNARERVVRNDHRNAGHLREQLVEAAQKRSSSGKNDAAIDDIRGEFRRRLLEYGFDRLDDRTDRFRERFTDLLARNLHGLREAVDQVAAANFHRQFLFELVGRTDLDFDLLGGPLADHEIVDAPDVSNDRFVHLIAGNAKRLRDDDPAQRDHGDVGRSAANVDDHASRRAVDR